MNALEALNIIGDLCASQRGMFTSAQAQAAGVSRMTISRLTSYGQIEQVARGVYRASAAPSIREEDVYAAWLALDPTTPAWKRRIDGEGFTASLDTAAWLHELGELKPEPITFMSPGRKQTRNKHLRLLRRRLRPQDVTIVAGIPVTTPARTILDLIAHGEDLSLVASVLADAERNDPNLDIKDDINSLAIRRGFKRGYPLYDYLRGASS